jgi:hypothetical protein
MIDGSLRLGIDQKIHVNLFSDEIEQQERLEHGSICWWFFPP